MVLRRRRVLLHLLYVLLLHVLLRHLLRPHLLHMLLLRKLLHMLLSRELLDMLLLLLEIWLRVLLRRVLMPEVRISRRPIYRRHRVGLWPIGLRRPRLVRHRCPLAVRLRSIPISVGLSAVTVSVRIPHGLTIDRLGCMHRPGRTSRPASSEIRIPAICRRIRDMGCVYGPELSTCPSRLEASRRNGSGVKRDRGTNARTKHRSMRYNNGSRKCSPRRSREMRAFKPSTIECLVRRMETCHIHSLEPRSSRHTHKSDAYRTRAHEHVLTDARNIRPVHIDNVSYADPSRIGEIHTSDINVTDVIVRMVSFVGS